MITEIWFNGSSWPDTLAVCWAHQGLPVGFFFAPVFSFIHCCFISFLYPDLYVLGNDALIS